MSVIDRFRLDGKRAFISGGSRGLGREMALALAEAGADIVLVARSKDSLGRTAADIQAIGRKAATICADMTDPNVCQDACEQAISEFGPIDILVNNVGGRRENAKIENQSTESWHALFGFNTASCFTCTRIVGMTMLARGKGGRILNVASVSAWKVMRDMGGRHYETAKAAVVQFTRAAAADWAPRGVTVNAICPGVFMTEANERWARMNPELLSGLLKQVPMGRFGQPDEIGPLAVYLACDAARYVTGAMFVIDGGYSLW